MAHEWKYKNPAPNTPYFKFWGCIDLRECNKCGAIQEKQSITSWMRIIGYYWYPKVGKCPNDKIMTAYKLFRIRKDGSLGSLFINKKAILPTYKWLKAENHPTKGYKERMGWHTLEKPNAPHLSIENRKWFEVQIKDYRIIERPKSQGGIWYLSKWIKILGEENANT